MLDSKGRKYFDGLFNYSGMRFLKVGLMPNHITLTAAFIGVLGAILLANGLLFISVLLLWVSGFLDAVDGAMARQVKRTSAVGTLLDIWLDRLVEIAYIIAFAISSYDAVFPLMILTCAIILSMTVFLTSGMLIENSGIKTFHYQSGLMERTEGFIMFTIMIIFNTYIKYLAYIYAALVFYTALQRLAMSVKVLSNTYNN